MATTDGYGEDRVVLFKKGARGQSLVWAGVVCEATLAMGATEGVPTTAFVVKHGQVDGKIQTKIKLLTRETLPKTKAKKLVGVEGKALLKALLVESRQARDAQAKRKAEGGGYAPSYDAGTSASPKGEEERKEKFDEEAGGGQKEDPIQVAGFLMRSARESRRETFVAHLKEHLRLPKGKKGEALVDLLWEVAHDKESHALGLHEGEEGDWDRFMWLVLKTMGKEDEGLPRTTCRADVPIPMLAKDLDKRGKQGLNACMGPGEDDLVLAQEKLDGVRCIANLKDGTLWTRTRQPIVSMAHISVAVREMGKAAGIEENLFLDGEIFRRGLSLQEISGTVRRRPDSLNFDRRKAMALQYHVFDLVTPGPFFETRHTKLHQIYNAGPFAPTPWAGRVVLVPTKNVEAKDLMKEHDAIVAEGGEGLIVRVAYHEDDYYTNKRSSTLLKIKVHDDAEFTIKQVEPEKGRPEADQRIGTLVLQMLDGRLFSARPAMPHEELKRLWGVQNTLLGKIATVKYFGLTPEEVDEAGVRSGGLPNLPRVINIRWDLDGASTTEVKKRKRSSK